ncbi:MAG: Valyl-tRNA synthetase [uncultured bacterium]|nr:MAG: Valyl-tRNA synthetase [uncultured bacterium]OGH14723.1 MAG: hypothetical protein A2687_02610 [Candidatus Levybacteria bacterium RIFCSPHIGHO2_01_FULL_38_26]
MDKVYNHKDVEERIYSEWEKKGYFKPEINPKGKPYCVILPPPNANGALHFGHAMFTIEDILIRYHRMRGFSALWLPGTDHAGIETQFVFEKKLKAEGKSRLDFDRDTLYKMIREYVDEHRGGIESQLKRLGFSLDWSREKYTLDPGIVRLVYKTFKKMHDEGLVYRGYRLVNYCTFDGTSFSDLEVVNTEAEGLLYYIKFPIKTGGYITIATTRPETMVGDVAVMVNPKDKRYKEFVGKTAILPMVDREIPVIGDEYVDMKFGTGAVKVTPSHDFNDFEIAKRHNLNFPPIIGMDGKMQNAGVLDGLYVKQARLKTLEILREKNLLEKEEKHKMVLRTCYKCKNVLEPLPLEQWFVKVDGLRKKAIDVIKKGKIKAYPKNFENQYFQWLENLEDWNISRQIVWGIRIPAWKCSHCHRDKNEWIVTDGSKPEKCPNCGSKKLEQDTDTFDTWFSSAQWPFATLTPLTMGFHEDVVPQVLKGKTKTYRLRDYGFKAGDKVLFENTQSQKLFGYGVIKQVEETTVEKIDYKDKTHFKTYESLGELIVAFKLRNPDKIVTPQSKAYLYTYESHPLKELENFPNDYKKFYPTDVMETGYDILKAWVSRMVMVGLYITGDVPFKHILLHGLVNDPYGKKMSKSKGNVINPLELVDKYGADSVRFALVYGNATGNDQSLSFPKLEAARKFTNKLWNMARFIDMKRKDVILNEVKDLDSSSVSRRTQNDILRVVQNKKDKEMIEETQKLAEEVTQDLEKYNFNFAAEKLYEFAWHTFADKYIEDVKNRIDENSFLVLSFLFLVQLKLLHPFMPFVTEEIYQRFNFGKSIMIDTWPAFA